MPQLFTITVTTTTGEKHTQSGQFPDDEWDLLKRFLAYTFPLSETGIVKYGRGVSYKVHWHHEQGETEEAVVPADDEVSAFLHRMRPFILQSEPSYLPRILNVLARRVTLPTARRILDVYRKRFLRQLDGDLRISTGEVELTSDETLTKWLNAFEYHRDEDKQKDLREITVAFTEPSSRAIFLISLYEKAKAVFETASLIRALEKRGAADATLPAST
jgi:hypothetical protein